MVAAVATFAAQDGFSKALAGQYNTLMVVMIRYWAFAAFVILMALRRPEGPRAAIRSAHLPAHLARGTLLVAEICLIVWGYTLIGLIESHAVFAICPLLIVALSGPILGERLSWQRWAAVAVGMHAGRLGSYISEGLMSPDRAVDAAILAVGLPLGNLVGERLSHHLSDQRSAQINYGAMALCGALALFGIA